MNKMKRLTPRPKKKPAAVKPPIPVNGWLKLWLKVIDKEMDNFHVEEFKKN